MNVCPARDRLAVWTYEEHGEQIPNGDPSVTDAERAAAGRETLADLWQAVLPGNRARAAELYSARLRNTPSTVPRSAPRAS